MGNFFPRWTNLFPLKLLVMLFLIGAAATAAVTLYWTQGYSRIGYMPEQPIPFDHSLHAGQLGMDCRYCHSQVERSEHSNIPTAQTCWTCHQFVKRDSEQLAPLRRAMDPNDPEYTGKPIEWVRLHKLGEYAYFAHQAHVNRGVSCVACHGKINEMKVVWHDQRLSMGWCLDCHREPEASLRPLSEITNLDWHPATMDRQAFYDALAQTSGRTAEELLGEAKAAGFSVNQPLTQEEVGSQLAKAWGVRPPESCTACHR
jgi:hypothetical protein